MSLFQRSSDKNKTEKLAAPKSIPDIVTKYLVAENKISADILPFLKLVSKARGNDDKAVDIRIFDPSDAEARGVSVKNYNDLTENPSMIIGEGWMNETTKKVEISVNAKFEKPRLFSMDEILRQIESLQTPGSSVFFFLAAGPGAGGPLGRGAAIVRFNGNVEKNSKTKKYSISTTKVIDNLPVKEESFLFSTDKSKDAAKWVADGHKPRFC